MKRADPILRYLSGEMSQEEEENFRNVCMADPGLREELEEAARAYELIKRRIREIDEEKFKSKLQDAMNADNRPSRKNNRLWWLLVPLAAASLVLFFFIRPSEPDLHSLYSRYYSPEDDSIILSIQQERRGNASTCQNFYAREDFSRLYEKSSSLLEDDPHNQLYRLYQLLAALELGISNDLLPEIKGIRLTDDLTVSGRALHWYSALAWIKAGDPGEAIYLLERLAVNPGPYSKNAQKLKKRLSK